MYRLLLIEDNQTIGQNIVTYLTHEWRTVDRSTDAISGRQAFEEHTYDLLILDIMLPGGDWVSLLKELRLKKQTPVIMTTAKGQIEDKQHAYELWADDYLVKPFALEELVMRCKALFKRTQVADIYHLWDIEIDLENKTVTRAGQPIHLTLKEFLILAHLIENNGHAVTRTDLIEYVWWGDAVYEHDGKLDVYIANLRKKLGRTCIETIKWFGYRIVL
jgi:DNA-binding response OmpR family regulator